MTDVYVMYNRARGVDFISPKDLIMGLEHAEKMFKGFKRKDFMGVKCVVGKQFREVRACFFGVVVLLFFVFLKKISKRPST